MSEEESKGAVAVRAEAPSAVATRPLTTEGDLLVPDLIRSVARMDGREGQELQRWVVKVMLHPKHQYVTRGASTRVGRGDGGGDDEEGGGGGGWVSEWIAAPRAEGYDLMNRVCGVQFWTPPKVHDRRGNEVPNPIHDHNYLYLRMIGYGYNDLGQMVAVPADVEIDFFAAWQAERLKIAQKYMKARDAKDILVRDEVGMPKMGPNGELLFRLRDADEFKAADRLLVLRNFGGRQAETIARRRIMTVFTSTKTLWSVTQAQKPELVPFGVTVVGWRDRLTTDERLAQAQQAARDVFHAPIADRGDPSVAADADEIADAEAEVIEEAPAREEVLEEPAPVVVTTTRPPEPSPAPVAAQPVAPPPPVAPPAPQMPVAHVRVSDEPDYLAQSFDLVDPAAPSGRPVPKAPAQLETSRGVRVCPAKDDDGAQCMRTLNAEGRHVGPHQSVTMVWPQGQQG